MSDELLQKEIDANYEAFKKLLPTLGPQANKYALMRGGKIINFYDTLGDAYTTGEKIFDDGLFSVQKVTTAPVNLGFLSHAVHCG